MKQISLRRPVFSQQLITRWWESRGTSLPRSAQLLSGLSCHHTSSNLHIEPVREDALGPLGSHYEMIEVVMCGGMVS